MILSYMISGAAALISALCYAEYAVALPVAGGAFNYIAATYGEFAAWCAPWLRCMLRMWLDG